MRLTKDVLAELFPADRPETALEDFEIDPTTENYLSMRKSGWNVLCDDFSKIEIENFAPQLQTANLSEDLVAGALRGDPVNIDIVCLTLLERLNTRKSREARGERHLASGGRAIRDNLVNHLVVALAEVIAAKSIRLPPSLVILIRDVLGGKDTRISSSSASSQARRRALNQAVKMEKCGQKATVRNVAAEIGVHHTTISRWFPDDSLKSAIAEIVSSRPNRDRGNDEGSAT